MKPGGKKTLCDNCGNLAGPRFCPHCGQEIAGRQGPLVDIGRQVLADVLSLDSRLLRSLRALFKPGRLSEAYLSGKRAPYLRPFRLYLVASLVVFSTTLSLETPDVASDFDILIGGQIVSPGIPTTGSGAVDADPEKPVKITRSLQLLKDDTLLGRWMIGLYGDRIDRLKALPRREILEMLFPGLRRMLPLTLIFFVPFLAAALKLLYLRRRAARHFYLDHLVFSLHYQSALFFALATAWLVTHLLALEILGSGLVYVLTAVVMLLVYLPIALRRFYQQSRLWTSIKTVVLLLLYLRLLGIALGLSVIVAFWRA